MIYEWKYPIYKVDAQEVGEYLDDLEKRNGEADPAVIVEEARSEAALLHNCFEWNDAEAAEAHRINQAKGIIRNISIVSVNVITNEKTLNRAFVSVRQAESKKNSYININAVLTNDQLKQQMLNNAKRELSDFKRKYANLMELAEVFKAVNDLLSE